MSKAPTRLRVETQFYESHKVEWLRTYPDKFVVVKNNELLGFFDTFYEAYSAGATKYGTGTDFLVKRVVEREPVFEVF